MAFTPLGDALKHKLKYDKPLQGQIQASHVVDVAEGVFRRRFSMSDTMYVKPLFLKNRTLTVTCSDSAIAQEIQLNQGEIVEEINQALGENHIDRIRYLT